MFNLLKSDIYRLVHGKMLWVAAIVLVALSVLAAGMMHWVSSPEFLRMTATSFEMTVNVSDGVTGGAGVLGEGDAAAANASAEAAAAASASGRGLSLDELDTLGAAEAAGSAESEEDSVRDDETASDSAFASSELWDLVADNPEALSDADFEGVSRDMRTLASPADMLGDMAVSGGALAMVVSLVTALFLAQDFSMRFARNLVMDRRGRVRYYGEKLVLVGLLAAFYLAVAALAGAASFAAAGFTYAAASRWATWRSSSGWPGFWPSPTGARRRSSCGRAAAPGPGWPGRSWSAPASPARFSARCCFCWARASPGSARWSRGCSPPACRMWAITPRRCSRRLLPPR